TGRQLGANFLLWRLQRICWKRRGFFSLCCETCQQLYGCDSIQPTIARVHCSTPCDVVTGSSNAKLRRSGYADAVKKREEAAVCGSAFLFDRLELERRPIAAARVEVLTG